MIFIYIIVGLVALFMLMSFVVRKVGCICHDCGGRMRFWNELQEDEQRDIMSYFQQFEHRQPDIASIFVCPKCLYVYDDFSGEKESREGDNASFCKVCGFPHRVNYLGWFRGTLNKEAFLKKNAHLLNKTECLSCGRNPYDVGSCIFCDTKFKVFGCNNCATLYTWVPLMRKKFKYMVPLTHENVLSSGPTCIPL